MIISWLLLCSKMYYIPSIVTGGIRFRVIRTKTKKYHLYNFILYVIFLIKRISKILKLLTQNKCTGQNTTKLKKLNVNS